MTLSNIPRRERKLKAQEKREVQKRKQLEVTLLGYGRNCRLIFLVRAFAGLFTVTAD